jgi:hypothetical protein
MSSVKIKIPLKSYKSACHLKCFECMGADIQRQEAEKGTNALIRHCTSKDCPIYKFRPYK